MISIYCNFLLSTKNCYIQYAIMKHRQSISEHFNFHASLFVAHHQWSFISKSNRVWISHRVYLSVVGVFLSYIYIRIGIWAMAMRRGVYNWHDTEYSTSIRHLNKPTIHVTRKCYGVDCDWICDFTAFIFEAP